MLWQHDAQLRRVSTHRVNGKADKQSRPITPVRYVVTHNASKAWFVLRSTFRYRHGCQKRVTLPQPIGRCSGPASDMCATKSCAASQVRGANQGNTNKFKAITKFQHACICTTDLCLNHVHRTSTTPCTLHVSLVVSARHVHVAGVTPARITVRCGQAGEHGVQCMSSFLNYFYQISTLQLTEAGQTNISTTSAGWHPLHVACSWTLHNPYNTAKVVGN